MQCIKCGSGMLAVIAKKERMRGGAYQCSWRNQSGDKLDLIHASEPKLSDVRCLACHAQYSPIVPKNAEA